MQFNAVHCNGIHCGLHSHRTRIGPYKEKLFSVSSPLIIGHCGRHTVVFGRVKTSMLRTNQRGQDTLGWAQGLIETTKIMKGGDVHPPRTYRTDGRAYTQQACPAASTHSRHRATVPLVERTLMEQPGNGCRLVKSSGPRYKSWLNKELEC